MNPTVSPTIDKHKITDVVFEAIRYANQLRFPEVQIGESVNNRFMSMQVNSIHSAW